MNSIVLSVPISREVLDFIIDAVLKEDQDPMKLYKQVAERYGESVLDFDLLMTFLEKEGIIEADIYGIKDGESPRYYETYSRNRVSAANRQEVVERLMIGNKILECERDETLFDMIITIISGKKYSFKEIQDEVMRRTGKQVNWVVLATHLLELKRGGKVTKGFVEREGHNATYYSALTV